MGSLMYRVCTQAEQDILHRNSLDAARRNSFCADVDAQRQDMQYPYTGVLPSFLITRQLCALLKIGPLHAAFAFLPARLPSISCCSWPLCSVRFVDPSKKAHDSCVILSIFCMCATLKLRGGLIEGHLLQTCTLCLALNMVLG